MGFAMHLRYCNLLFPDERSCQIVFTDTRARETKFHFWLHLPLFISGLRCMSSKEWDTKAQRIHQGRDSKMTLTHCLICPSTSQAKDRIKS